MQRAVASRRFLSHQVRHLLEVSTAAEADVAKGDLWLQPDFVSEEEARVLVEEAHGKLKKLRYEPGHYDNVIVNFREVEKPAWTQGTNATVIERLKDQVSRFMAAPSPVDFLPPHVLDLNDTGYIKPHVDHVSYSGVVIAGLSLLSTSVMRLVHTSHPDRVVRLLLPPRSFYIQRGEFRYNYTHEICERGSLETMFAGQAVPSARRISIMLRDVPIRKP